MELLLLAIGGLIGGLVGDAFASTARDEKDAIARIDRRMTEIYRGEPLKERAERASK